MEKSLKHGRCLDCPKGRPGILSRIIHGGDHLDTECPGPENILVYDGLLRVTNTGKMMLRVAEVSVCSKKITQEMREQTASIQQKRIEKTHQIEPTEDEISAAVIEAEQQAGLDEPATLIV